MLVSDILTFNVDCLTQKKIIMPICMHMHCDAYGRTFIQTK